MADPPYLAVWWSVSQVASRSIQWFIFGKMTKNRHLNIPASPWLDPQRQWWRMHTLTLRGKRISETMSWDDSYSHGSEAEWPSLLHSTQIKLKGGVQLLHTEKNLTGPDAQVSKQVFKISINKREEWRGKERERNWAEFTETNVRFCWASPNTPMATRSCQDNLIGEVHVCLHKSNVQVLASELL